MKPTRTSWCVRSFAIILRGSTGRSGWATRLPRSMPGRQRGTVSKRPLRATGPADPEEVFRGGFRGLSSTASEQADFRFLRFRPPLLERTANDEPALPHIRLDRVLQFLIGDRLQ